MKHQFLVHTDDVNLLGNNTRKNTKALTDASKEVGQEVNIEKTMYMSTSRHLNAEQDHNIKIAHRSFEYGVMFKYFRTMVTDQNFIHDEIKIQLNLSKACYHSVQNIPSSCLVSKS
jgi:hypothetical protein